MNSKIKPTKMQEQILALQTNIAVANQERHAQLLKLADAPDDTATHDLIAAIEGDIADYQRALARLEASEAEAARRDSKEARKARYEHLKGVRAHLADTNGKTEALAAKLQETFDALGPLFAQLQLAIEDRAADARAIIVGTRGEGHQQRDEMIAMLANFQTGEITESVANLVADSGLAKTAIQLDPYVIVSAPSQFSAKFSLGDAVARANAKLLAAIDGRVTDGKKMLLGGANV